MRIRISLLIFLLAVLTVPVLVRAQTLTPQQKAQLEQELQQVLSEQKQAESELARTQAQSASLQRDINVLAAKIKAAQLDIKAKNLLIQTLGTDIVAKQNHITDLEGHIVRGKEAVADILRETNELGQYSLPEVVLSQSSVAGFFQDIDSFDSVHRKLQSMLDQLRADEASTAAEKDALDARKNKETDARYAIQQEQKNIQTDQDQEKQLLTISKGNEKSYNALIAQKQARAAQIRAALFNLVGANPIPFGDAYSYAQTVYRKTGVQPSFLLAIITQESNLGKNVGQCVLTNNSTGDGVGLTTGVAKTRTMSPARDVPPFLDLLRTLGLNQGTTPVSCWIPAYNGSGNPTGWGGAMGPAQFIASTWTIPDFLDRIKQELGISDMPNPWNPLHAFMAAGVYLSDRGAGSTSYSTQKNAACKYYSGSACGLVRGNTAYGNSVMALADNIQRTMIEPLQGL